MKKKQLMMFVLSGALVFGSVPGNILAETESDISFAAETEEQEENNEEEVPGTDPEETPAPSEDPEETPAPSETPEADPTETPVPTEAPAPTETPVPTETPEETVTPTPTEAPEEVVIDTYDKLKEAVEKAEDGEVPAEIQVSGTIVMTAILTIPSGKKIKLIPAEGKDAVLVRDDSFVSDMFEVSGGATLILEGTDEADLTLDGKGIQSSGSLVSVKENGNFGLGEGAVLTNNKTASDGGAIKNRGGKVLLLGGTIENNEALKGGAIDTDCSIQIGSEATSDGVNVQIKDNKNAEGKTDNIYLEGAEASIHVKSPLTKDGNASAIGITAGDESREDALLIAEEDMSIKEDVLPYVTLENEDYELSEEGTLVSVKEDPVVTETPTPQPTATPEPTATPTSIPSPTPTKNIKKDALKITSVKWNGRDSISVSLKNYLEYAGSVFYEIVPDGSEFKKMDTTGEGIPISANGDVTFTIDNSEQGQVIPDGVFRVYVQAKYNDKDNTLSQIYPIKIDQSLRPAPTATPAPTTRPALIYRADESIVDGLSEKIPAYAKKMHFFTVIGAGSDNMDPQEGDVKWEASYWSAGNQKHYKDKFGRFYMIFAKDYEAEKDITIQIHYTKYIYRNGQWVENGEEALPYTITVYPATAEKDPELQNGSGAIADPGTLEANGISLDSDSYVADNAQTADTTPVASLAGTLAAAFVAAVAALLLKLKRN